jgi:hypothetical protein
MNKFDEIKKIIETNRHKYFIVRGYIDYKYTPEYLTEMLINKYNNNDNKKIVQIDDILYSLNDKNLYVFYQYNNDTHNYTCFEYMRIERHDDSCTYVLNKKSILDNIY